MLCYLQMVPLTSSALESPHSLFWPPDSPASTTGPRLHDESFFDNPAPLQSSSSSGQPSVSSKVLREGGLSDDKFSNASSVSSQDESDVALPKFDVALPKFDVFANCRKSVALVGAATSPPTGGLSKQSLPSESVLDLPLFPNFLRPLHLAPDVHQNSEINERGERVFYCIFCPYSSTRSDTLKVHIRTHTGEKPYFCPHCPYRCNQKSQLSRHVASKHGGPP